MNFSGTRLGAFLVAVLLCASSLYDAQTSAQAPERPRPSVLAIYLGPPRFPTNPVIEAGFLRGLAATESNRADYFAEYLEPDSQNGDVAPAFAEYLRTKYANRHFDVVVAMSDVVLAFVREHRSDLFPDAAIVFSVFNNPDESLRASGRGMTGITLGVAYTETLKLALRLHPSTEQAFVVASASDPKSIDLVRDQFADPSIPVPVTIVNEPSMPRLLERLRATPPRSVVLFLFATLQEANNTTYSDAIAPLVAGASPVPVYGTNDFFVGTGVVGGVVRRTGETGEHLGRMTMKILTGTRAQDIPVESARTVPILDWRQLKRWNVDTAALPDDAVVQFVEPTVWEKYRGYILGVVIIFSAQLAAITGLLVQRSRRRRAEKTILLREGTIRASYEQIRQLTGRMINAEELTRVRIARDLHDDVCQGLAGLSLGIASVRRSSGSVQDSNTQEALARVQSETVSVYEQIRQLSHELHPASLRIAGLPVALKAHCAEAARRSGVEIEVAADDGLRDLPAEVASSLFRIAQEALRNSVTHGGARHLSVAVTRSNDHVEMIVRDDGCGFDQEAVRRGSTGLGLLNMQERAHAIGGSLEVITGVRQGTELRVSCPVPPETTPMFASAS